MASAKGAVENLVSSLPNTAIVSYVSYTTDYNYETGKWNKDLIDVSQDLDKLNLEPYGGTNTDKGLEAGINRFSDSNVSKKILVLVTDGEVSDGYGYKPSNYNKCDFDLYTVGFTYSNQKLEDLTKGEGEYFRADDDATLKVAFDEMKTRISAMIVDPMGDKVDYQKNAADAEGSVKGSFTTIGSTLYWIPKETTEIPAGSTIKYTYTVKLNGNASREDGDYTKQVPLNGETYLQYGIEKGDKKEACKTEYEVPVGSYKVSTLTESFEDMDGKTINEATPHPEQHEITDFSEDSSLTVYGAPQSIATSDPHERYVYLYSTLNGDRINEGDADENGSYATFADYDMNVYDQTKAYELVHVYKLEQVNSVSYEYKDAPADLNPDPENLPETQWFKRDSVQTCMEKPTSDKYNFSGWEIQNEDVNVDKDGKFTLSEDVVFQGSWSIKPSYQVQANYYTVVDGEQPEQDNKNGPISLTEFVYVDDDEDVRYTIQPDDCKKLDGQTAYDDEVAVALGSTGKLEKGSNVVTDITPTQEGTTVTLCFYHYTKTHVEYTVTHEYYDVDPDGNKTLVEAYTAVDTYRGEHEETIQAADVPAKNVDTYTETGRSPESIQLNKDAQEKANITITYKHYDYRVTVTGDAGVTAINGDGFTYSKGKNGPVNFKLKPGYQLASVTDQAGTDEAVAVTASADANGVYSYSIKNIQANHVVDIKTEQIKYKLTVNYVSTADNGKLYESDVTEGYVYDQDYTATPKPAPFGYYYTNTSTGEPEGKIKGDTEVTFYYAKNGVVIVNYYLKDSDPLIVLKPGCYREGIPDETFDLETLRTKSITTSDGKKYTLTADSEKKAMTGVFKKEATEINLYYEECAKSDVVVKYESEKQADFPLNAEVMMETYTGYVGDQYDVSKYVRDTIVDKNGNTWYRSGASFDVSYGMLTGTITKSENGQPIATIIIKYYLKPTYQVKATYNTVNNGTPDKKPQVVVTAKEIGTVGANIPFDKSKYDMDGFTYQNDLKVNDEAVADMANMPVMEKFGEYLVTLSYKETVNNPQSTTLNHVFYTVLDNGPKTEDKDKALTEKIPVTYGKSANMEEYAKKGAGYEGYNAERYSHKDKMLPAGANGTIYYVRNLVSVVFDLNGGTWKNSQDDVNYTVVKNTGLNQQPVPQPTRDGYNFVRWVAQPDNAVTTGKFDQRTVFTAEWTPKAPTIVNYFYTVTYNYTVTTDGTVTYQDSETTQVQDTTKASQTINASATASHGGYTFDLASPAEQTADLTGTTREAPHQFVVNYVLTVNNNGGGGGRDDRDDDDPKPNPGGDTEIKDDDVPKTDLPEQPVEIPDEDTPKTDLPQAPVDIPDEDTPKADVPKTGDAMGLWVMAAVASGAGLVWLNLTGKKRKDDNG